MTTERKYVFYRDVEMVAEWPEKIRSAQKIPQYRMGKVLMDRIRFDNTDRACGDCAVMAGEFHVPGCDLEVCPKCAGQVISCGCEVERP